MSRFMIMFVVLFCTTSVFATWENRTNQILLQKKSGNSDVAMTIQPSAPVSFTVTKEGSYKLIVKSTVKGSVELISNNVVVTKSVLNGGSVTLKKFLSPGTYKIVPTVPVTVKIFVWKRAPIMALQPVGGGHPVYLSVRNKQYTYFKASEKITPELKVKGPTTAYVYVRGVLSPAKKTERMEVLISEEKTVVAKRHFTFTPSSKAVFVDDTINLPSDAEIISFKVPEGLHTYRVTTGGEEALIKFYKNKPKAKTSNKKQEN